MGKAKKTTKTTKSKAKDKVKAPPQMNFDPRIEEMYEKVIEFDCPVRGRVKQKVLVKRYKSQWLDPKQYIHNKDSLDKIDDGSVIDTYESDGDDE